MFCGCIYARKEEIETGEHSCGYKQRSVGICGFVLRVGAVIDNVRNTFDLISDVQD